MKNRHWSRWFRIPAFSSNRKGGDVPYYKLAKRLFGIRPGNLELYKLALVHKSASVVLEDGGMVNNERLEFLGDAVIGTVVSEMLFLEYPEANEGYLSKLRSRIVSRHSLNGLALDLGLDQEIVAHPSNLSASRNNIYGDALEALAGALYLDQGYNRANRILVSRIFAPYLDLDELVRTEMDFKSRVIEWGQKHHRTVEFQSRECDDHVELSPHFETLLLVGGVQRGYGDGRSKKEAEQMAANEAYGQLLEEAGEQVSAAGDSL